MPNYTATNVPPRGALDIAALDEKYRIERDKRIRKEGQNQYAAAGSQEVKETYEHDPYMEVAPREPVTKDIDVVILGGGFSGVLAGVELAKQGITNIANIDHAGDFGGVWYWNRYPGVQCDNDAYCYMPILEEMGYMPSKKYVDGWEIYEYCQQIATKHGLYENALFHTLVKGLRWDNNLKRWRISTDRGDDIRARHVIMANGLLNIPKFPAIPGVGDFKGCMFHTSRWDYSYTGGTNKNPVLDKLAGKKVAIVGTGATALQAIPYLGKYAKHLYVVQRTPCTVDQRKSTPTDPEWVASLPKGWHKERVNNFQRGALEAFLPNETDLVQDFWTEISRNMAAELESEGWPEISMDEFMERRNEMDYRVMERMRERVASLVNDPETAEKLKPYYGMSCKRPLSNDDYYDTYNRDNVSLIDVADTQGLECITENGFMHQGEEIKVDCIIFASGFEVTSDLERRWGFNTFEGRDGLSIYDHWRLGYKTLHGMMTSKFPNQYFIGYYQGGLNATTTEQYRCQAEHIAYIIKTAKDNKAVTVEPSAEAEAVWVNHVRETAIDISALQEACTPGYYNNEGEKAKTEEGKEKFRFFLGETYGPGWGEFTKILDGWCSNGKLEGLILDSTEE